MLFGHFLLSPTFYKPLSAGPKDNEREHGGFLSLFLVFYVFFVFFVIYIFLLYV